MSSKLSKSVLGATVFFAMIGSFHPVVAEEIAIIVHRSNTEPITNQSLRQYFWGYRTRFNNGKDVLIVDQVNTSEARRTFLKKVMGTNQKVWERFWLALKAKARRSKPKQTKSASFIIGLVSRRHGAIGYVATKYLKKRARELVRVVATVDSTALARLKFMPTQPVAAGLKGMVLVVAGEFLMGSKNVGPIHKVYLDAYYIDATEVTQAAYKKVMGANPSTFENPKNPVESVTWFQARQYCQKVGKRLPTEAEWEKVTRAGSTTTYHYGEDGIGENYDHDIKLTEFGNYCGMSCAYGMNATTEFDGYELTTAPVKTYNPNPWGIYDVYGNVAEWVSDWYGDYAPGKLRNPAGAAAGDEKVIRGGSYRSIVYQIASASRDSEEPDDDSRTIGFRCAADVK